MTRVRAALEAAYISIHTTYDAGRRVVSRASLFSALFHAYRLGYGHGRTDAAQAVSTMVGEHEIVSDDQKTVAWGRFD